jgi:hypothetical protein
LNWEVLATPPSDISDEDLQEVIGYTYARGIDPRRVLALIFKFSRGGSSMIPQGRRFEFLKQLAALAWSPSYFTPAGHGQVCDSASATRPAAG